MMKDPTAVKPAWLIFVAIVVLGAGAAGIFVTRRQHAVLNANARIAGETTVVIPIQGMSCAVCAANVKKALRSVEGVQEAAIDLEQREAWVRYGEGKVSPERLMAAINQLGYKAGTPVREVPR